MPLLQGQEIYSTQLSPDSNPGLQFDLQVTGGLQEKYDSAYNQASLMYGSILNAAVTREDSGKIKEEYLQKVKQDLKRLGKIDFSISSNVKAAASLFDGIYSNKNLVKDIVWTRNFNDELARAEMLKNCTDPEKCGGQYWDEGIKFMQYKREEFMKANPNEALRFEDVPYVPYNSVIDQALKTMKESGLSMEYDHIEGGYKITTKNGDQLKSPLTALFNKTLGSDPKFIEMFKVKAYVQRKDWAYSKLNLGEYSSEEEASLNYYNELTKSTLSKLDTLGDQLAGDSGYLDQKLTALQEAYKAGSFQEGSDTFNYMSQLQELKASTNTAQSFLQQLKSISESGNKSALSSLLESSDMQQAFNFFDSEINQAVDILAFKDYKQTMEADPFALKAVDHKYRLAEQAQKFSFDVRLENLDAANAFDLAKYKAEHGGEDGAGDASKTDAYNKATQKAKNYDSMLEAYNKFVSKDPTNRGNTSFEDFKALGKNKSGSLYKDYKRSVDEATNEYLELKRDSNLKAVKLDLPIQYPEAVTAANLNSKEYQDNNGGYENFVESQFNYLIERYGVTPTDEQMYRIGQKMQAEPTRSMNSIFYSVIK